MKFILLIFCLMCSNVSIAQKKDTIFALYKENIELKKQLTDIEKTIIRVETEYKVLEKTQNTWLTAIGIISTLIVLVVGFSVWNNYRIAKDEGIKAGEDIKAEIKAELKAEFDPIREDVKSSQEKLESLNVEIEEAITKSRAIVASFGATDMDNQPPNNP